MSNGAAGCGWEYRDMLNNWKCNHLNVEQQLFGNEFTCRRFHEKLTVQRTTDHPFRCKQCLGDSEKYNDELWDKQKKLNQTTSG